MRTPPPRLAAPIIACVVLLGVLILQRTSASADAQPAANRPRGEYTLLSGKLSTGGPNAVYVLDSSNNEVVALRWDQSRQTLIGIGYRNLANDTNAQVGR